MIILHIQIDFDNTGHKNKVKMFITCIDDT